MKQRFIVAIPFTVTIFTATFTATMPLIFSRYLLILLTALLLTACSSAPEKKEQLTEKQYYEDAQSAMDNNRFVFAIEKLQSLESRYPFGRYADQAQL
ncbi:MAG: hypothetical protein COA99_17580, partial [Moraxellaceae bacterium]